MVLKRNGRIFFCIISDLRGNGASKQPLKRNNFQNPYCPEKLSGVGITENVKEFRGRLHIRHFLPSHNPYVSAVLI